MSIADYMLSEEELKNKALSYGIDTDREKMLDDLDGFCSPDENWYWLKDELHLDDLAELMCEIYELVEESAAFDIWTSALQCAYWRASLMGDVRRVVGYPCRRSAKKDELELLGVLLWHGGVSASELEEFCEETGWDADEVEHALDGWLTVDEIRAKVDEWFDEKYGE